MQFENYDLVTELAGQMAGYRGLGARCSCALNKCKQMEVPTNSDAPPWCNYYSVVLRT